jgi:hypothetical protein
MDAAEIGDPDSVSDPLRIPPEAEAEFDRRVKEYEAAKAATSERLPSPSEIAEDYDGPERSVDDLLADRHQIAADEADVPEPPSPERGRGR